MIIASDLEGTLTSGATWKAIGRYLCQHGQQVRYQLFLGTHLLAVPLVKARLLDEQTYRDRWLSDLAGLLTGMTEAEFAKIAEWVVEDELWPKRRPALVAELDGLRAQGHRVIVSTGAYQPVAEAFSRRIGAVALGTPLAVRDGRLTGHVDGPTNTGSVKAEGLRRYLAGAALDTAYGDTCADLPMLELSQTPVVVEPEPRLRAIAVQRGWRIMLDTDHPRAG